MFWSSARPRTSTPSPIVSPEVGWLISAVGGVSSTSTDAVIVFARPQGSSAVKTTWYEPSATTCPLASRPSQVTAISVAPNGLSVKKVRRTPCALDWTDADTRVAWLVRKTIVVSSERPSPFGEKTGFVTVTSLRAGGSRVRKNDRSTMEWFPARSQKSRRIVYRPDGNLETSKESGTIAPLSTAVSSRHASSEQIRESGNQGPSSFRSSAEMSSLGE